MIVTQDGLRWLVDSPKAGYHPDDTDDGLGPEHEASITGTVLGLLPRWSGAWPEQPPLLLDIGAHVGHYSIRAAAQGARVIAVEANPDTAGRLLTNAVLNNVDKSVRIIPHPAWDTVESFGYEGEQHRRRNASGQARPDGNGTLYSVVLDDELGVSAPHVVKIDTEGAELHVLRGLRATLKRARPVLWIEDHAWLGTYTTAELLALLGELGYNALDGGSWSGLHYWHCVPLEQLAPA